MADCATTKLMNIIKSLDQLDDSGNNFDSWLFKLDNRLLVSAGLKESLDIKITNEDDEEETVNALTSRQHWKKIAGISNLANALPQDSKAAKTKRHNAFTAITTSLAPALVLLIRNLPNDPAIATAAICDTITFNRATTYQSNNCMINCTTHHWTTTKTILRNWQST